MDKKAVIRTVRYTIFVGIVTWIFLTFIAQKEIVDGNSMYPNYENGEKIWVNKLAYRIHDPERFDVVVFALSGYQNTYLIKRIIGLPGETISIDTDGVIFINGIPLTEGEYAAGLDVILDTGLADKEIILAENEYFVLGDNRNDSIDSRFELVGNVKRNSIIGRVGEK